MKYIKPAVGFADQIAKLVRRGLIIQDRAFAEHSLSRISYYRLRAYTYPYQDNSHQDHPFTSEVRFEEIIMLYKFDRKLRVIVFDAIEKIEIALRTQIIYQLSMSYGSHWQTDPTLFRDTARFTKHLTTLEKEVSRSDETFIKHYRKKYTSPSQPPCWMSLEVASLGTLSKFYQNLKLNDEKRAVATSFGLPSVDFLESWMLSFSHLRNICAHHGRLWNRRLTSKPKLPYNTSGPFLSKRETKTLFPNKLYANLCCVMYMLDSIDETHKFRRKILKHMEKCLQEQEKEMGFPANWQEHKLWKVRS